MRKLHAGEYSSPVYVLSLRHHFGVHKVRVFGCSLSTTTVGAGHVETVNVSAAKKKETWLATTKKEVASTLPGCGAAGRALEGEGGKEDGRHRCSVLQSSGTPHLKKVLRMCRGVLSLEVSCTTSTAVANDPQKRAVHVSTSGVRPISDVRPPPNR